MTKEQYKKDTPLISMHEDEREGAWDDAFAKEEGIILEFDLSLYTGKLQSLADKHIYNIDGREFVKTKIELRPGDKVVFAPFENLEGGHYAKIISVIDLKTA